MRDFPEVKLAKAIREKQIADEDREFHGEPGTSADWKPGAAHRLLKEILGSDEKIAHLLALRKKVYAKLN